MCHSYNLSNTQRGLVSPFAIRIKAHIYLSHSGLFERQPSSCPPILQFRAARIGSECLVDRDLDLVWLKGIHSCEEASKTKLVVVVVLFSVITE